MTASPATRLIYPTVKEPAVLSPRESSFLSPPPDQQSRRCGDLVLINPSPRLQVLSDGLHDGALMLVLQGGALRQPHSQPAVHQRRRHPLHLHPCGGVRMRAGGLCGPVARPQEEKPYAGLTQAFLDPASTLMRCDDFFSFSSSRLLYFLSFPVTPTALNCCQHFICTNKIMQAEAFLCLHLSFIEE